MVLTVARCISRIGTQPSARVDAQTKSRRASDAMGRSPVGSRWAYRARRTRHSELQKPSLPQAQHPESVGALSPPMLIGPPAAGTARSGRRRGDRYRRRMGLWRSGPAERRRERRPSVRHPRDGRIDPATAGWFTEPPARHGEGGEDRGDARAGEKKHPCIVLRAKTRPSTRRRAAATRARVASTGPPAGA